MAAIQGASAMSDQTVANDIPGVPSMRLSERLASLAPSSAAAPNSDAPPRADRGLAKQLLGPVWAGSLAASREPVGRAGGRARLGAGGEAGRANEGPSERARALPLPRRAECGRQRRSEQRSSSSIRSTSRGGCLATTRSARTRRSAGSTCRVARQRGARCPSPKRAGLRSAPPDWARGMHRTGAGCRGE